MSYDIEEKCGREWLSSGKDHKCIRPEGMEHRCTCDCGEKIPSAKRPQLKLAHWKRGRKKVTHAT